MGVIVGAVLAVGVSAAADGVSKLGKTITNEYVVKVDGAALEVKAIAVDGTSYAPIRAIANAVGRDVVFQNNEVLLFNHAAAGEAAQSVSVSDKDTEAAIIDQPRENETDAEPSTDDASTDDASTDQEAEVVRTTFEGLRAVRVGDRQYFNIKDFSAKALAHFSKGVPVKLDREIDYTPVLKKLAGLNGDHPNMVYMLDGEAYFNVKHYQDPTTIQERALSEDLKALIDGAK